MVKRRLTYRAAAVVLADLLALGAVWHVTPTLGLTVGLAVPEVARALARRDIAVLVPTPSAGLDATVAHARTFGVPVRVESVASFLDADGRSTVGTRAAYAWRLLRLSYGLLTTR